MENKPSPNPVKTSLSLFAKSSIFLFLVGAALVIISLTMDETEKKYDEEHYARTGNLLYKWNRNKPLLLKIGVGILVVGGIVLAVGNNKKKVTT